MPTKKFWVQCFIIVIILTGMFVIVLQNNSAFGLIYKLRLDKVYRTLFLDKDIEEKNLVKRIKESDLIVIGKMELFYCVGVCVHEVEIEKVLFGKTEKRKMQVTSYPDAKSLFNLGIEHSLSIDQDKPKAASKRCIIFLKKSSYRSSTLEDKFFIQDFDFDFQCIELVTPEMLVKIASTLNY